MGRSYTKVSMTGWRIDERSSEHGNITIKDAHPTLGHPRVSQAWADDDDSYHYGEETGSYCADPDSIEHVSRANRALERFKLTTEQWDMLDTRMKSDLIALASII